ncbi:hypothetical protein HHL16_13940 [Pseudoflavitalea sp. G-6-1-2]|uniref:fasciclin domain-containing protein n=1 Tax=Pseudoflavitalea sp. G-6-1-2 TaxID=2728841 RepID=UPI00146EB28F|nr:fasciclin domain-containing protein [Pseudoflavitalea sp. G-6-1-2]NML21986.1 hypothetical protein [Pseudoflavitalea sp. G-6-1-2]
MKPIIKYSLLLLLVASFASCKKDYLKGGSLHDPKFNGSTYEYLKTNALFDTLVLLIDKTGLKDEVNAANNTFFAPTDYAINNYVKKVVQERKRLEENDENLIVNFSDLDFGPLKDSLRAYIFQEKIARDNLNKDGKMYASKDGEQRHISLRDDPSNTYTTGGLTITPQYIYFSKVIGAVDPVDNIDVPDEEKDLRIVSQTSGIITNNGMLHVLANNHIFTFAKEPK